MRKLLLMLPILVGMVLAAGEVKWQENGICICDGTFGGGSLAIAQTRTSEAVIVWNDVRTHNSLMAQRIDSAGSIYWPENGAMIYGPGAGLGKITCVLDNCGGIIVIWEDYRSLDMEGPTILAQKVDSGGNICWHDSIYHLDAIVVAPPDSGSYQCSPQIVSDGENGSIVGFGDKAKLYLVRVDSGGNRRWCTHIANLSSWPIVFTLSEDSKKGALVSWGHGPFGDLDTYIQRVDSTGKKLLGEEGIPVCTAPGGQTPGWFTASGQERWIITWTDHRDPEWECYAQRITGDGEGLWQLNGILVSSAEGEQVPQYCVSDGEEGVLIIWNDISNERSDLYIQGVDINGAIRWQDEGLFIITAVDTIDGRWPTVIAVSDDRNGAITCWSSYRSGKWEIWAQRVTESGELAWGTDGLPICNVLEYEPWGPVMVKDNTKSAIIAWGDSRPVGPGASIYAQRVGDKAGAIGDMGVRIKGSGIAEIRPNPFHQAATIRYQVRRDQRTAIKVYDASGGLVRVLEGSGVQGQESKVQWDGKDAKGRKISSGVYFCALEAEDKVLDVKKAVLVR